MGMDYYLERPKVLPRNEFAAWSRDVRRVLDALPGEMIRGETGVGEPTTTDELVAFSGNPLFAVGNNPDADAIYRDPIRLAHFRKFDLYDRPNDRWNEFHVARTYDEPFPQHARTRGWWLTIIRTQKFPWDRAVTAALILLNHHMPDDCRIGSDYEAIFWEPGLSLARAATRLRIDYPWSDLYKASRAAERRRR